MRLLHASTISLEEISENKIPPYAILSHTWENDEVSFQDMEGGSPTEKEGYSKVKFACQQALSESLEYVWVDTCCIDKSSSSELSEAINSMFTWYRNAESCYAYLVDVPSTDDPRAMNSAFRASRWFTRGWTLQELIAPLNVRFYSKDWSYLGSKGALSPVITEITDIDSVSLSGGDLRRSSIAKRMSWASKRVTTRKEDMAYCLLGIFDVNMSMLYGEGEKAFIRLQEEIIKESDDQSIFAWELDKPQANRDLGVLARTPAYFASSGDILPCKPWNTAFPPSMTSKGLRIELPIYYEKSDPEQNEPYGILSCHLENDLFRLMALPLCKAQTSNHEFTRSGSGNLIQVLERTSKSLELNTIYIHKLPPRFEDNRRDSFVIRSLSGFVRGNRYRLVEVYPPQIWNESRRVISTRSSYGDLIETFALMHFSSDSEPDFLVVVEYMPREYYGSIGSVDIEDPRAHCHLKSKPKGVTLAQLHKSQLFYVSKDGDVEPLISTKLPTPEVVKGIGLTLKKEEVMGVEMFVLDIELESSSRTSSRANSGNVHTSWPVLTTD
ncbi:HET-domain-containing protein [Mollisia scopiformis]|uniref:HET-domain-containing protein n=1 Tax=Mollisia scopiformis TaxID=149040 RepID=A0A194XER8_MOLSC|nr:HET-domain-containing protein [Mollisia scopiformis]KUJ18685.1 HET-domain-containing protein [Mollisia scopiformis]